MADEINYNGITVNSREELKDALETALRNIYGQDIALTQDSPDGQTVNIYVQKGADDRELAVQVYNSFDPNAAIGKSLDRIAAINGIRRKQGSYTLVDITIDTDAPVILYGLDQTEQEVFTVQDDTGNRFQLATTQRIRSNQSLTTRFRAEEIGEVITTERTITTIVTPVVGVTGVNNLLPDTTVTGSNEESDFSLRTRRMLAVDRPATGFVQALKADLQSLEGIETVVVEENRTDTTDSDGTPAHHVWVILEGTASPENIANVIYRKRGAGAGMRGANTHTLTTIDGTDFVAKWDNPLTQKAFLTAEATSRDSSIEIDYDMLKNDIFAAVTSDIGAVLNYNQLFCDFILDQSQPLLLNNGGLSTGHVQNLSEVNDLLTPAAGEYSITYNGNESARIVHNDNQATIESKIKTVTGLADVTVAFATNKNTYSITFDADSTVEDLVRTRNYGLSSSSFQFAISTRVGGVRGGENISVSNLILRENEISFTDSIQTIGRSHKFSLTKDRMIIKPIKIFDVPILVSTLSTSGDTFTASADGGFGTIRFYLGVVHPGQTNVSPIVYSTGELGSINSETGVYTISQNLNTHQQGIYVLAIDEIGNFAVSDEIFIINDNN